MSVQVLQRKFQIFCILLVLRLPCAFGQDQVGRRDILKGNDGQTSCQLREAVHAHCSSQSVPGLDQTPIPTPCTCNIVYFNLWSACSYATGNNTLPLFSSWLQTCTNAGVDVSASAGMTTTSGALGINVPGWSMIPVPGNTSIDLQQAVVLVQLAQRPWSVFQIVLPVVSGIIAALFTLFTVYLRQRKFAVSHWKLKIAGLIPNSHRIKTTPRHDNWEIEPIEAPSRVSSSRGRDDTNTTHTSRSNTPRHYIPANQPPDNEGHIAGGRIRVSAQTIPGNPSDYVISDGTHSRRESGNARESVTTTQLFQNMSTYAFSSEAQVPFNAYPLRSQNVSRGSGNESDPSNTSNPLSQRSMQSWQRNFIEGIRIPNLFKRKPVPVRTVYPGHNFKIDGSDGIISGPPTLDSGSSFLVGHSTRDNSSEGHEIGGRYSSRTRSTSHSGTGALSTGGIGTEIDPIHEEDENFYSRESRMYTSPTQTGTIDDAFDEDESTRLISGRDQADSLLLIGNPSGTAGSRSTNSHTNTMSISVDSHIRVVSPSITSSAARRNANLPSAVDVSPVSSSGIGHESYQKHQVIQPPVPPLPKLAAPMPPIRLHTPARKIAIGTSDIIDNFAGQRGYMNSIQEDQFLDGADPSSRSSSISGTPQGPGLSHSTGRLLPTRSGSQDSTASSVRPLPSPATVASASTSSSNQHFGLLGRAMGGNSHPLPTPLTGSIASSSTTSLSQNPPSNLGGGPPLTHVRSRSASQERPSDFPQPFSGQMLLAPVRSQSPPTSTALSQTSIRYLQSHERSISNSSSSGISQGQTFSAQDVYGPLHRRGLSADDDASFYLTPEPGSPPPQMQPLRSGTPVRSGTPRNDLASFYPGPVRGAGYGSGG